MTTPRPDLSISLRKPIPLDKIPLVGLWFKAFGNVTLANASVRAEAKVILWSDLSLMLEEGMSLEDALAIASTKRRSRWTILVWIFFFFFCWFSLLLPSLKNPSRVAAILAERLAKHSAKGLSLSQSMARLNHDFSKEEIELVAMAEKGGMLPETLRRLSEFTSGDNRMTGQLSYVAYPVILGFMLFTIGSFIIITIVPKFQDIFAQLGAELPWATTNLIHFSYAAVRLIGFGAIVPAICFHIAVRFFLTGSAIDPLRMALLLGYIIPLLLVVKFIIVLALAATGLLGGLSDAMEFLDGLLSFTESSSDFYPVIQAVVLLLSLPWLLLLSETIHLKVDQFLVRCVTIVMELFGYVQRHRAARWLAALDLTIRTKQPLPDALRFCGACAGGSLRRRSIRAAADAERGVSLPDIVERFRLLPRKIARQICYFAERGQLPASLRALSEDMAHQASEQQVRAVRVIGVVTNILAGLVVGFFCLAIYSPLFSIPKVLIAQEDHQGAYHE